MPIELRLGDITRAKVDAIVNAANSLMLGGGGVDGAIHKAAGEELLLACQAVPLIDGVRCPTGQARITPAGRLNARYVIHTVGPRYYSSHNPHELLNSAYQTSLKLALKQACKSIAFPAISCGVYAYPPEQAAEIAIKQCLNSKWEGLDITFYLFNQSLWDTWKKALDRAG